MMWDWRLLEGLAVDLRSLPTSLLRNIGPHRICVTSLYCIHTLANKSAIWLLLGSSTSLDSILNVVAWCKGVIVFFEG